MQRFVFTGALAGALTGALAVALAGGLGLIAAAQQPPPPQPTFRGGVTLVTTDVIARDGQGRFVPDLKVENLSLSEDGVPQKITSFTLVHGGRSFNLVEPPPEPAAPEGIVLPPTRRRVQDASGRVLIVFIDDLHFEPEYTPHVRRLVTTLVETLVHDGDLVGAVSSGASSIEINPTYDRKLLAASVSKIRGQMLTAGEIFKMLETSQGPGDLRARAQVALQTAYAMVSSMDQVHDKRKAVVFISPGYDLDPFAEGRNAKDHIMGGRFSDPLRFLLDEENPYFRMGTVTADIDLYALMKELTLAANRTNTSLFTVDPRGLAGIVDAGQYIDQSEWRTFLQKTQSTLRYLAEETGGFAVVNDNDFQTAMKRIDAETSDYYLIGYTSTNPDPKKRVRSVEVKVDRPGVTVSARREYSLKTPGPLPPPNQAKPLKPLKKDDQ